MQYAMDTVHLAKSQWEEIVNYCKEKTIIPFINDINNFESMQNTIINNYYV
jgi:aspartate/tyrosine/aromatic aminotransferase